MNIDQFKGRLKTVGVLYVDVYPYCIDRQGDIKFLVLKRKTDVELPDSWQAVSGKIKKNEKIKHAFFRQVEEKTGQRPLESFKLDTINIFYDDYYDTVMFVPIAGVKIEESPIVLSEKLHVDYKWLTTAEAKDYFIWPKQIECIDIITRIVKNSGNDLFKMFRKLEDDR